MSKNRVPIVDKNGKATHVWRVDEDRRNVVERVPAAPNTPQPRNALEEPISHHLDKLWSEVQDAKSASAVLTDITKSEPAHNSPQHDEWEAGERKAVQNLVTAVLGAQGYIEDLEAELTAFEEADPADRDADWTDLYNVGVGEVRLQKSELLRHLQDANVDKAESLSPRVTRTWEQSVAAVEEVFGRATITQDLPNGSSTFIYYNSNGENNWKDITVNRLGNVTRYRANNIEFEASSIDFPVSQNGESVLRGTLEGRLPEQVAKDIVYIATGVKDARVR